MMKEQELLDRIEEQFHDLLPPAFRLRSVMRTTSIPERNDIDILATLNTPVNSEPIKFAIEVKSVIRTSSLLEASYRVKAYANRTNTIPVVAGKFFGARLRELLKEQDVNYFDLAGNFYLNLPFLYVEKVVDKNPFTNTLPLKNLFAPVSSRITRALLIEPKKHWYLSDLSNATKVSAGQTHNVLKAMLEEKFASRDNEGKWYVEEPAALLEAWKEHYPTYQHKKYSFFSYSVNSVPDAVRKAAKDLKLDYTLGFFNGADLAAPYIRGANKIQFFTTEGQVEQWRNILDLKEVNSAGNVEIYIPYDEGVLYGKQMLPPELKNTPVASNIQLYMDLFNNPARGEEAAEYLRKGKIGF